MKKREFNYSCYSARVILIIGNSNEISNEVNSLLKEKGISCKNNTSIEEVIEAMSSPKRGIRGCANVDLRNYISDQAIYLGIVRSDFRNYEKLPKKTYERALYKTGFHESRHLADRMVIRNDLSFNDLENTARLQADLDINMKEIIDDYLEEKED